MDNPDPEIALDAALAELAMLPMENHATTEIVSKTTSMFLQRLETTEPTTQGKLNRINAFIKQLRQPRGETAPAQAAQAGPSQSLTIGSMGSNQTSQIQTNLASGPGQSVCMPIITTTFNFDVQRAQNLPQTAPAAPALNRSLPVDALLSRVPRPEPAVVVPSPIGASVSVQAPQQSEQIFGQKRPRLMKRRPATLTKCTVFVKWAVDHIRKHDKERITQTKLIECFIQSGTPYNFKDAESMFKSNYFTMQYLFDKAKNFPEQDDDDCDATYQLPKNSKNQKTRAHSAT